ncbi:hypothetical protein B0J14DRAFT_661436 [Halenospora varia]|nr:hypothetical protein B0J14DRAFT_661436 [Halenospora varia]
MASSEPEELTDCRNRLKDIQIQDVQRGAFIEEIIGKLENVQAQLVDVSEGREKDVAILRSDLENERESRLRWQDKARVLGERISSMEKSRFVLVLIDADADMYMFDQRYLSRGLAGGQDAADDLTAIVREYCLSLGFPVHQAENIPIVVKAYANLFGLGKACAEKQLTNSVYDVIQFWIGFSRRHPLFDFVNVGSGKEEADNKIREVLGWHLSNLQCEHVLLACCGDSGYLPVLRQHAAKQAYLERLTLLSVGSARPKMCDLGFPTTFAFEPLFNQVSGTRKVAPSNAARARKLSSPTIIAPPDIKAGPLVQFEVENSKRLGPILRNVAGKRIDQLLSVNLENLERLRKKNLCSWHYLRSDCVNKSCRKGHGYPKPISTEDFEALWVIARVGKCHKVRKTGDCEDRLCFYSHGMD